MIQNESEEPRSGDGGGRDPWPRRRSARDRWARRGWAHGGQWLAVWALCMSAAVAGCRIERTNGQGAPASAEPSLYAQVDEMLATQVAAWNRGDLEAFMSTYDRSPATSFIGAAGVLEGYDAIRANYAAGFEPGAARDSLRFEQLRARALDPRFAVVTARYVLQRGETITSTGPFTLVLMNVEGAWKIVHDQSAADPENR